MLNRGYDWSDEKAPDPARRRRLKRAGLGMIGFVAIDQLPPIIFWHDDQTRVEKGHIDTKRLALVTPGIGNKDVSKLATALRPSLGDKDTTLSSLVYPDQGLNPRAAAQAILDSGCRELTLVGHSLGGGFNTQVVSELRPHIESGRLAKPNLIFLNTGYSGRDVQSSLASPLSYVPLGFITKSLADVAAFGGFNNNSVRLEASQLDQAVDYDGATVAPGIVDLIGDSLYIGDAYPDGVIDTPSASASFKQDWGDKLTVVLVPGLGHPDPAGNERQVSIYNNAIRDWRTSLDLAA